MTPVELLARLAALVPPPRVPLVIYHRVLAPHAKQHSIVVPKATGKACKGEQRAGADSPPIAKERVEPQQDGLVRLSLKRAFADGTVAVDMDPLSLLCRLAASVPPPRFHTVKYTGVLASTSPWRKRIGPRPAKPEEPTKADDDAAPKRKRGGYRPWAELLRRTFAIDILRTQSMKTC
ncbi:transposase [Sorangium sp. So ce124]|uniref:transposase n=1 Tax=Sorangium sp. So ce124 TaxID=3133280 RepID=UPI003F60EA10